MRFAGKVAIVTGAGRGIGEAVVHKLASEGANIVCVDTDKVSLDGLVGSIGNSAIALPGDVSDACLAKKAVDLAKKQFGGLHFAVNNAGIGGQERLTADLDDDDWQRVIAVNLSGVFYGMREQVPAILENGGGAVVNVASMFAKHALRGHAHYTASKYGVVGLTRAAAVDYATQPIRINSVCPGVIDTPLARGGGDTSDAIAAMIPQGRLGRASEVANVVAFLLSEEASYITASEYDVDGGILH